MIDRFIFKFLWERKKVTWSFVFETENYEGVCVAANARRRELVAHGSFRRPSDYSLFMQMYARAWKVNFTSFDRGHQRVRMHTVGQLTETAETIRLRKFWLNASTQPEVAIPPGVLWNNSSLLTESKWRKRNRLESEKVRIRRNVLRNFSVSYTRVLCI